MRRPLLYFFSLDLANFFKVGNYKDKEGNINYLSEDFYFSALWRDLGGKIFADLTSELSHLGKYSFFGSPSFNLKKKLDEKSTHSQ